MVAAAAVAAVTVAIDAAPFRGVLPLPLSALKAASPVLGNPLNYNRSVPLTYEQFRFAFANVVDESEAHQLYEMYAVPGWGVPLFQAATANLNPWTTVDHLGRTRQHRAGGDLQCLLQATGEKSRRHGNPRDAQPRAFPGHRPRVA